MNKRWLLSKDGQAFIRLVAEQLRTTREGREKSFAADLASENVEDLWELVKTDFIHGLEAIIARDLPAAEEAPFRERLNAHYELRFRDGYDTMDATTVRAQAIALGNFTGNMYRLHKGEIGPYPGADPDV